MKLAIATALLIAAGSVSASDYLLADIYSIHKGQCVAVKCAQPHRLSWQKDVGHDITADIGAGTNSYRRTSVSVGALWQPLHYGVASAGIWAAAVSGYSTDELRTRPLAGGLVGTLTYNDARVQLLYVPSFGEGTTSVINLRLGVAF